MKLLNPRPSDVRLRRNRDTDFPPKAETSGLNPRPSPSFMPRDFRPRATLIPKFVSKDSRLNFILGIFLLLGGAVAVRLFTLQVLEYKFYAALASGQQEIYRELFPERGKIYVTDRLGKKLYPVATNKNTFFFFFEPRRIKNPDEAASKLAAFFELDKSLLFEKLNKPSDPYEQLKNNVSEEDIERLRAFNLEGVNFLKQSERYYPEADFGHITGFVGFESDGSRRGRYGLEGFFEKELVGKRGFLAAAKDAAGRIIGIAPRNGEPAIDGSDLILTIDRTVQAFVCERLNETVSRHSAAGGTVVVVNPETGALIAMCSSPNYDPNNYSKVADISVFNNPALFFDYEPGSVMKPLTMAAAIDSGLVTPETTYRDDGFVEIGRHVIKNSDGKTHGIQTMTNVLEQSLNTGAVFLSRKLGPERLRVYFEAFGLGAKTGVELETEVTGNISSLTKPGEIWSATASYGQGITATPIQLAMAYAALGNGGKLMRPFIIAEIRLNDRDKIKTEPVVVREVVSPKTSLLLSSMLVSVVKNGHGKRAVVNGYDVAGKTGTAEIPLKDKSGYDPFANIGTFAGFAPVDNPKFAMVVRIDKPHDVAFAESTAAPLFGEIAKFLLQYYEIPPDDEV